jgi:hypothetical protein
MPTLFRDVSHHPQRALQIYLVLIGLAYNRQNVTYRHLSVNQLKYGDGGILAGPLDRIMRWCDQNRLPPLTALVVAEETGAPGDGLITVTDGNWPMAFKTVFDFDWFSIMPPTIEELESVGRSE